MRLPPADHPLADLTPAHEDLTWASFTRGLTHALSRLRDEEFLILQVVSGGYVQFAGDPDELHAEAMSLQYIDADPVLRGDTRLLTAVKAEMGELGWRLPTELPPEDTPEGVPYEGSPNYSMQWAHPIAYNEAARCAVATLQRVYGAASPRALRYVAFANAPHRSRSFPELGIRRAAR